MIAALNQFILRSTNKCRPFFQLLKKRKDFQWTDECQVVFDELKLYLSRAPILTKSMVGEALYMYLVMKNHVVSVVLLRLDYGFQKPIIYISETLVEAETHYLPLEKAALAIIHAS